MKRAILLVLFGLLISLNSYAAEVGKWAQGELVTAADGAASDSFSYSWLGGYFTADSDANRMIVGAIGDDVDGFPIGGGAYIFDNVDGAWVQQQKLTPVDPATAGEQTVFGGFLYGSAVSIDGDIAVVGEFEYNNNGTGLSLGRHGQATVYRYNSIDKEWAQTSILNAGAEEVFESSFGTSATIDADGGPDGAERILVGGVGRTSEGGFWTGKAYIFDWSGSAWVMKSLKNPAPSNNDYFGAFSDLDGNTAIVGALAAHLFLGEAWIFEYDGNNWGAGISLHGLIPSRFNQDRFGSAVAVDGDFAVVGAYDSNAGGDGTVYIFWNNPVGSWELFDTLTDGDGDTDDQFGRFVQIKGNHILISASNNEVGATASAGSVYVYEFDGVDWVFKQQINRDTPETSDGFAFGATFSNSQILVGVGGDDTNLVNQGGVMIYNLVGENVFKDGFESIIEEE